MAYETPITIKKVIEKIRKRQYVLPSIQREFVWDVDQIERLFDSLMRDYPISTFLFWKVEKQRIKDYQFYEFLRKYHEKDARHNTKADLLGDEDVVAILDGQQRMTSIYVALTGTYANKIPYYRWDSPHAFPEKKLYLNLLSMAKDLETEYDFQFLTYKEVKDDDKHFWFECGKVLEFEDVGAVMSFLMETGLTDTSRFSKEEGKFALNSLIKFFNIIHNKGTVSYYLEESEELDKVLQIFIRINSGGTKLSYSDLLLSIATAQWQEKDAREIIHEFVDEINKIGEGFGFNKDFVLKSCLVLADFTDIKFKVDNFTKENMRSIEKKWDSISVSVRRAIELASKFGYSRDNLLATNTIIPIAYFIYKNGFEATILHNSQREVDRKNIKEWLARVLLKGTFGGQPDSIYPIMRNIINENRGKFPLAEIILYYKGKRKSISFTEDDIDSILEMQYGKARTYCALTLLYPALNYSFKYHQDHIHPKSLFNNRNLVKLGIINEDQKLLYLDRFNKLPNLQLLQATQNIEKSNKNFNLWLNESYPNQADEQTYLMQHHIPSGTNLEFSNFIEFFDLRRRVLREKLIKVLNVQLITTEA